MEAGEDWEDMLTVEAPAAAEAESTTQYIGAGEFLGRLAFEQVAPRNIISFQDRFGPEISRAACAYALAMLAAERAGAGG